MLTVEQCIKQTITFRFIKEINNEKKPLYPNKIATLSMSDFSCLVGSKYMDKDNYSVMFRYNNGINLETFRIDDKTAKMLIRVFFKHNINDRHVGTKLYFTFNSLDHGKTTILGGNIESVTHETFSKIDELFKVITTKKSYSISREDYDFFKKMIINREEKRKCGK